MIRRNITYKEKSLIVPLYKAIKTSLRILYTGMESISQERHSYMLEKMVPHMVRKGGLIEAILRSGYLAGGQRAIRAEAASR